MTGARRKALNPPKVRIILNLPYPLASTLRALAVRERRPLTTQVEILVEQALGRGTPSGDVAA